MAFLSSSSRLFIRYLSTAAATDTAGHAFDPAIRRLARAGDFSAIESAIRSSSLPVESAITNYVSAGMLEQALASLSSSPSPSSLNSLLSSCNHHPKLFLRVPDLFSQLTAAHSIAPDGFSYSILIKSLCRSRKGHQSLQILKDMETKNIQPNVITYTTIMDSFYKEDKPAKAGDIWNEMLQKGLSPDAPAYNVRIMHKALTGKPDEVLSLIAEMEEKGLKPDTITFNYLIECYCRNGKMDLAKKVYDEMEEKGCEPSYATFRSYITVLCKKGKLDRAIEVMEDSMKRKRVPDLGTVRMLVQGLVKKKKGRAAKRVVTGLRHKFGDDFAGGWLELLKMVGLDSTGGEEDVAVAPA
ncbi:putative pentatricopeptide repeat-containing protein, mitochondrial [Iris pallida]|uniref:Pentatricopeptide repeat-containing protein, mitochondrial n=1 Tax=Iris pallida TaxID=29817 RepID=A0AAX6H9H2_IRIPA|nr:putative pentatricopeptide repeat-containing protein, mitochondrial [Iris pallida]